MLFLFSFCAFRNVFAIDLLLDYPNLPGATTPTSGDSNQITETIKYVYVFALGISGIVALISILLGAGRYIFSAGNPSKATDAKDQIFSAVLGILLLVGSVLILRTINPDLVNLNFGATIEGGYVLPNLEASPYSCECCTRVVAIGSTCTNQWHELTYVMSHGGDWGGEQCKPIRYTTGRSQCQRSCSVAAGEQLSRGFQSFYRIRPCTD